MHIPDILRSLVPIFGKVATRMGAGWTFNRKRAIRDSSQACRKMTATTSFDLFQVSPLANAARHFVIPVLG